MGRKHAPKGTTSNISSAANPATSSATHTASKSSILRSAFSPSALQLSLFASVIRGFDSQHLRIHDTVTGRLRCEHSLHSKASITCLDWGYHGHESEDNYHQLERKRKRSKLTNGVSNHSSGNKAVIAFGTSDSEIHLYSPLEAKIVGRLRGGHQKGVRDFKFVNYGLQAEGWSIGGDGRLVQWDLKKNVIVRNLVLPHAALALQPLTKTVLLASQDAYILDPESKGQPQSFHASNNSVHSILTSAPSAPEDIRFLTAADNDHFVNVFKATSTDPVGSLRSGSALSSLDLYSSTSGKNQYEEQGKLAARMLRPREAMVAVTKEGVLEIFPEPFDFESEGSLKDRMKQRTRKAAIQVRVKRPDKGSTIVPLINASFQGNDIAMAWAEGGASLMFEKLQWRDESSGNIILESTTDIIKAKIGGVIESSVMNGVKDMGKTHVDESRTIITNGEASGDVMMDEAPIEVIEISSGVEDSDSEDETPDIRPQIENTNVSGKSGEKLDSDIDMEDAEAQKVAVHASRDRSQEPGENEEPSFGDLLRANAAEPIDVQASSSALTAPALIPSQDKVVQHLPSAMSLGTVLTQSLRTNDINLLESCFHVKDLSTVRATIERLDSTFATTLLQRLAERLHSRPGRAGSLMVWIQWTIVAHGGFLSSQPELMKKLASLHRVVQDRAKSLQSLLSLKGKLDMLEAQMNLRKSMQLQSAAANALEEDDEEGVIYVEGQEESDSEMEDAEAPASSPKLLNHAKAKDQERVKNEEDSSDSDSEDSDASGDEDDGEPMPTTNGIIASSEDDESDSDEEGFFNEEASSTDNDSVAEGFEDDIDHESVDSVDSSDADAPPPPKKPAKSITSATKQPVKPESKPKSKSKRKNPNQRRR